MKMVILCQFKLRNEQGELQVPKTISTEFQYEALAFWSEVLESWAIGGLSIRIPSEAFAFRRTP